MAKKLLILLIPITIEAEARVQLQLSQTGNYINHVHHATKIENGAYYASVPAEIEKEAFTTTPPPIPSAKKQNILKAVVVIVILAVISGGLTVIVRLVCNRCGRVGSEKSTLDGNERKYARMKSVGSEKPNYEPRLVGDAHLNYELTICKCNTTFALCGLSV